MADNDLDLAGWDIRKTLSLLRKSNPPLLEWLSSPIVYRESAQSAERLRALVPEYYSPLGCLYHYRHMAEKNVREHITGDTVWTKKYFYVLRPLLACLWIERDIGPAPMELDVMADRILGESPVRGAVADLVARKKARAELDSGPRIPALSDFIERELARLAEAHPKPASTRDPQRLDDTFLAILSDTWGSIVDLSRPGEKPGAG